MITTPAPQPQRGSWLDAPLESGARAGFGAYLHVPFCAHRCGYCDFATATVGTDDPDERERVLARYVDALTTDLARQVAAAGELPAVTSVFVGGGTPSLLPAHLAAAVIDAVRRELDVAPGAEVTVECNPESTTDELLAALVASGVDRVSLGGQSFVPAVLTTLERGHGPEGIAHAVARARAAGIGRVSVDLIYGTPGEREEDWLTSLVALAALDVDHVSAYALSIHANTPFGRAAAAGTLLPPDDDVLRERFDVAREVLAAHGFVHYEVSNWARGEASRSRHNVLYWRHGDYLGVGVGAHAHRQGRRSWSTRSLDRYVGAVEAGDHGGARPGGVVAGEETLTVGERASERLLLGLRLHEGIHPADLPPIDPLALADAVAVGLVEVSCGRLRATDQGRFLLDEAVERLTP